MRQFLKDKDTIAGFLLLGLCSFVYIQIIKFPQTTYDERSISAAFFPTFLTVGLVFLAVLLLIRGFRNYLNLKNNSTAIEETKPKKIDQSTIYLVFSAIVYVIVLETLGFVITTIIYLLFIMSIFRTGFLKSLLISVLFSFTIFYVFQNVFKIMLPRGFFGFF
ncbi:MAG: hypothetical protein JM58_16590 [Peptococcaceae bacterium BICA1-8]|nr:MAG: hypothetical protein JM58_16590 [Peptococcaceae bacterium BICA1-8]